MVFFCPRRLFFCINRTGFGKACRSVLVIIRGALWVVKQVGEVSDGKGVTSVPLISCMLIAIEVNHCTTIWHQESITNLSEMDVLTVSSSKLITCWAYRTSLRSSGTALNMSCTQYRTTTTLCSFLSPILFCSLFHTSQVKRPDKTPIFTYCSSFSFNSSLWGKTQTHPHFQQTSESATCKKGKENKASPSPKG